MHQFNLLKNNMKYCFCPFAGNAHDVLLSSTPLVHNIYDYWYFGVGGGMGVVTNWHGKNIGIGNHAMYIQSLIDNISIIHEGGVKGLYSAFESKLCKPVDHVICV